MSKNNALLWLLLRLPALPSRWRNVFILGLIFCLMGVSASATDANDYARYWAMDEGLDLESILDANVSLNASGNQYTAVIGDMVGNSINITDPLNTASTFINFANNGGYAVCIRTRPESLPADNWVMISASEGNPILRIHYYSTGKYTIHQRDDAGNFLAGTHSSTAYPIDGTAHLVCGQRTSDTTQLELWVDGIKQSDDEASGVMGALTLAAADLYIGSLEGDAAKKWQGSLDEAMVFTRHLTAAEMLDLNTTDIPPAVPSYNDTGLNFTVKSNFTGLYVPDINVTLKNSTHLLNILTANGSVYFENVSIGTYEMNFSDQQWPQSTYHLTLGPLTRPEEDNDITTIFHFNNNSWFGEDADSVYDFASMTLANLTAPYDAGYYGDGGLCLNNHSTEYVNVTGFSLPSEGTIMQWFYMAEDVDVMRIWSFGTVGGDTTFRYNNGNKMRFALRAPVDDCVATTGASFSAGNWYHGAVTWNGTDCHVYVNGSLEATDAYSGALYTNDTFRIGVTAFTDLNSWNGSIDEFVIYNRSLTAAEVSAYYRSHQNTNVTNENNITGNATQSTLTLNASEIVLPLFLQYFNVSVSNYTFTTTNGSITIPIEGGTLPVSLTSFGWWGEGITPTFTNLTDTVYQFNVTKFKLNITAVSLATGGSIPGFTVTLNLTNGRNHTEINVTTDGTAAFEVLNGTYNMSITAIDYAPTHALVTFNESHTFQQYNFTLFVANTFNITFLDEVTGELIDNGTSFLDLISDPFAGSYNTTNGTLRIPLLTPAAYVFRYRSEPDYPERFYYFNLSNGTFNNIQLYLLNSSSVSNVTITVIDENALPVEGAHVTSLRFDPDTNTYISQERMITNFAGEGVMSLELNTEYYQFIISYDNVVRKTTNPSYVRETTQTFQIVIGPTVGEEFENYLSISYNLSFNNETDNFVFTYVDFNSLLSGACLYIYRTSLGEDTLINSSCPVTSSGTIVLGVPVVNGTTYRADAHVILDGTLTHLLSQEKTYAETGNFQDEEDHLFLLILFTMLFCFLGRVHIIIPLIFAPLPVVFWSLLGWIRIEPWATAILYACCITVAVLIMKRS